jgi:predicted nuclease of predicted toxin-antitoxin system
MFRLLADEDVPMSTVEMLRREGFEVLDVREVGLRGKTDDEVFDFAQQEQAVILTGDVGFGNLLRYPLGTHAGIIVVHYPNEMSCSAINGEIRAACAALTEAEMKGALMILEPGRIRLRRPA